MALTMAELLLNAALLRDQRQAPEAPGTEPINPWID